MTYFVILELLFIFLPDVSQNFAANLQLSCFLIGNNTLVSGNDCDTKTAQYAGKLFLTSVYTQAGFGDSLDTGNDLVVLIFTVFQGDVDGLERTFIQNIIFFNWLPGSVALMRRSISGKNAEGIRQPEAYITRRDTANVVIIQACLPWQMRQIKSSSAHEKNAHTKHETRVRPIKKAGTICAALPIVPIKRQMAEKMSH